MQVVLLRVGIDTGSGGILGPLFSDGLFEYIPIPDSKGLDKRTGDVPLDVEKCEAVVTGCQPMRLSWFGQDARSMRLCLPFVPLAPCAGWEAACGL